MPRRERHSELAEFQARSVTLMREIFGDNNVKKEWDVAKDSQDAFTRQLYCPRLDIAVGPFNIDGNIYRNNEKIERALSDQRDIINKLFTCAEDSEGSLPDFLEKKNKNPRCVLAIEIEDSGSRKHMLGDMANASIIGSIGIIIPFNPEKLIQFKKIKKYVAFATDAGKIQSVFRNILIVSKENFLQALACHS